jgi:acetoin utilization deacetylase AcuC-like enzyme
LKPILIKDTIFLKHDTKAHPESIERLIAIYSAIEPLEDRLHILEPLKASKEDILTVHSINLYQKVKEASKALEPLDADTVTSKESFIVAKYAAGSGIRAINEIKNGLSSRAFCAIRPPGHHATKEKSMGFCLFNNIAISARYAQKVGYKKVFIIDFDVHHGNGTQDIFYSDSSVFYFSTHQAFAYPGSGNPDEVGIAEGKGYTYNHPLMPNSTDKELLEVYQDELPSIIDSFNPDIILVSAGYDLHESDPLAMLDITHSGIKKMVEIILNIKKDIPIIFFLEGGYSVKALASNVKITLEAMIDS